MQTYPFIPRKFTTAVATIAFLLWTCAFAPAIGETVSLTKNLGKLSHAELLKALKAVQGVKGGNKSHKRGSQGYRLLIAPEEGNFECPGFFSYAHREPNRFWYYQSKRKYDIPAVTITKEGMYVPLKSLKQTIEGIAYKCPNPHLRPCDPSGNHWTFANAKFGELTWDGPMNNKENRAACGGKNKVVVSRLQSSDISDGLEYLITKYCNGFNSFEPLLSVPLGCSDQLLDFDGYGGDKGIIWCIKTSRIVNLVIQDIATNKWEARYPMYSS